MKNPNHRVKRGYRKSQITKSIIKSLLWSVLLLVLLLKPNTIFAHTLKVDGTVGVTVHLDPDDAPVAGKESTIYVAIKDSSGSFDEKNPGNCECVLTIQQDGKIIQTLPVVSGNMYNPLKYTFENPGSYEIVVTGKPNGKESFFAPFRTTYDYYVSSEHASSILTKQNPLQKYMPFVILVAGFVILFMFLNPFKKRK